MAKSVTRKKNNNTSVISFIVLAIILISVFVVSGNFSNIITTITKSKASQANPKVTQGFTDNFKADSINTKTWTVASPETVTIKQTASDNLRITVANGGRNNAAKGGALVHTQLLPAEGDFKAMAVLYRPTVTGDGAGASGLGFNSRGSDDDEGAVVRWTVEGESSKAVFRVMGPDGTELAYQEADLAGNIAILRLDRINKTYRAYYKLGRDITGDVRWTLIGELQHDSLGNEGKARIFTNNQGKDGKFPRVVGRFDTARIQWEGEPRTNKPFTDSFADGALGKNWNTNKSAGVQIYENPKDNLIVSLASGSVENKPRQALINRKQPSVPADKNFSINASLFKPTVVGEGRGFAGLRFVSATSVDDEAASMRWVVGTDVNKLVFVTRNPDGTLGERAEVAIAADVKKLTLRLVRNGNKYAGWYRRGDGDASWVRVGSDVSVSFGANGKVGLNAYNIGYGDKYPRVVARFDTVWGSIAK